MSFIEPPLTSYPYVGWIPTANGRLSFRHIGEARHPTEAIYANVTTDQRRVVVAYQRRSLSDALFQPIIHYVCNIGGAFWFCLAAYSIGVPSDSDEIRGTVFVYKSKRDWREKGESTVRTAIYRLNGVRLSLDPNRDETIEANFNGAVDVLKQTADIEIDFHLSRTGEVYLTKPKFQDPELEYASVDYATCCGHDFPRWMADQSYFFLRDLAHTHQHHSPFSDTILILQERTADPARWRSNVIYALYFYIVRARRFADGASLAQAGGVLVYCMSFKKICERHLAAGNKLPPFNDEALIQSLNARSQEITGKFSEWSATASLRVARAGTKRTLAITFVAVVVALLVMLVQPLIESQKAIRLRAIGELAATNFFSICGVLAILVATVWLSTRSEWQVKSPIGRDILELSNVRRLYFAAGYIVAAVIIVGITAYISTDALKDIVRAIGELWSAFRD